MPCPLTRPLLHLHFSKTGGTELCAAVRDGECRVGGHNCGRRVLLQDGPWWVPYSDVWSVWHKSNFAYPPRGGKNRTCAARRQTKDHFFNVESPLPSLCPGFDHSAILRVPLDRAHSQARALTRWGMVHAKDCTNYTELRRIAPALFDNYYVRMLNGEAVYATPLGSIGEREYKRARSILSRFTLVATLHNMSDAFDETLSVHIPVPTHSKTSTKCVFSTSDRRQFRTHNRWDVELYSLVAKGRLRRP